jgi:hypothetical protein
LIEIILGGFMISISVLVLVYSLLKLLFDKCWMIFAKIRYTTILNFDDLPQSSRDDFCSICLENFIETREMLFRKINICQHTYHQSCIDQWLRKNQHCPLCRSRLI